jgi:hypothetical protein
VALCSKGEKEAGLEELTKAVLIDAGYARGWYTKALAEAELGREADAVVSVGRAIANGSALSDRELSQAHGLLEELSDKVAHPTQGVSPR